MSQVDKFTKKTLRKYWIELGSAMLLYMVILSGALLILKDIEGLWLRSLIALTPMIPIVFATIAIYRHVLRMDELQRLQALRIIAVSAAGTAVLSIGYGFLEIAGLPQLSMMVVWPVMAALWVLQTLYGALMTAVTHEK
ncbi:MAG: hypothetical protein GKS03_16545 [Alphaproteobacteria bacterium]|nr:hypothetical protein [Alphaproteobacteria bacterium]